MNMSAQPEAPVKELLTSTEVESIYGLSARTLRQQRYEGTGPAYVKTAPGRGGKVLYRRRVIEEWLDERTVEPANTTTN